MSIRESLRLRFSNLLFDASVCVCFASGCVIAQNARPAPAQEVAPVAAALETIFCPDRNPPNRTMGLVQRNFLDLIENSKSRLQIAIVIDGTESMDANISDIKGTIGRMLDDLELYKEADVAYQLVVYRDSGAPSGSLSFPFKVAGKKFVSDRAAFREAFESIATETGAPYFHELADVGVHAAIQELDWADDEDTTKWLLLIGDAPPFDSGFEEGETGSRRHFATKHLIGLANLKQISINCILSTSRPRERQSYEAVLELTRQFMNSLASETGGLMLDLSYPEIRDAMAAATAQPKREYAVIGKITREEVDQLREKARQAETLLSQSRRAQIAVLPHLPLESITFRANRPEVQVATDLRRRFRNIPGLEVKASRAVQQRYKELRSRGLQGTQLLQMLASTLDVDYIVWGTMTTEQGVVRLDSSIYRAADGRKIVTGQGSRQTVGEATTVLIADVVNTLVAERSDPKLVRVFNAIRNNDQTKSGLITPVSNNKEAVSPLLEAYDLLEQATAMESGSSDARAFLMVARSTLEDVIDSDSGNPIAHQLLANCHFNQAQAAENQGKPDLAQQEFAAARAELERAKSSRNRLSISDDIKNEILADYALLAQKDAAEAIQLYERLTRAESDADKPIQLHIALRAHWMLAGIRSGDWGVGEEFVDPDKAREHLTAILAHWPKSGEAEFIRAKLRWDEAAGENAFDHYPHQGPAFLDLIDIDADTKP